MNQNLSSSQKPSPNLTNFIETLKRKQQSRGLSNPNSIDRPSPFSFSEIKRAKELEKKRIEQFHKARSKEWAAVYSAKQKQIERRIEEIREQLKTLAKKIVRFELNVTQAVSTQNPEPGVYHLSFLDHLRTVIELLKKNIAEANSWLSLYNQRSKKKGYYWGQAQKKGTTFTLNQERQLTTSIG